MVTVNMYGGVTINRSYKNEFEFLNGGYYGSRNASVDGPRFVLIVRGRVSLCS